MRVSFIYKCRKCGGENHMKGVGGDGLTHLIDAIHGTIRLAGDSLNMLTIHYCLDGTHGIADLIGTRAK